MLKVTFCFLLFFAYYYIDRKQKSPVSLPTKSDWRSETILLNKKSVCNPKKKLLLQARSLSARVAYEK